MEVRLWHCRFWFAPTSRVTSVTMVRPRWVRNGAIAGSVRLKVCSAYALPFQPTIVIDWMVLLSDP